VLECQASEDLAKLINGLERQATSYEWTSGIDRTIDAIWLEMIATHLARDPMPLTNLSHWVKPSGTTMATLHIRWHYPSFTAAFPFFGCMADLTNPCLSHATLSFRSLVCALVGKYSCPNSSTLGIPEDTKVMQSVMERKTQQPRRCSRESF
jgi:hypothetical protein